jgi:hypothetical protein
MAVMIVWCLVLIGADGSSHMPTDGPTDLPKVECEQKAASLNAGHAAAGRWICVQTTLATGD